MLPGQEILVQFRDEAELVALDPWVGRLPGLGVHSSNLEQGLEQDPEEGLGAGLEHPDPGGFQGRVEREDCSKVLGHRAGSFGQGGTSPEEAGTACCRSQDLA